MPTPVQPLIIVGPAILKWNGYTYYCKDGMKSDFSRETWFAENDFGGKFSERLKSQKTVISFTPEGMISRLTTASGKSAIFPFTPAMIGQPGAICGLPSAPLPVEILTQFGGATNNGQTITFVRGGMTKVSHVKLGSQDLLYDEVEFTCLGNPTVQSNTAGSWNAQADAVFADATYDSTQIVSDIYTAALGSTTPYNTMGAHNGFEVELPLNINEIRSDDYGITDLIIDSYGPPTCSFAPSNLTEAQIWTMLNAQGSGVILPGMDITASGGINGSLVLTGSGNGSHTLTVTLPNMAAKSGGFTYDKKNNRIQKIMLVGTRTWTTGAPNPLLTIATT